MAIASINPATGEKLKEFSPFDDAEIEKRLKRAENASRKYRRTALSSARNLLEAAAELLSLEKERLARIITLEMGKLFSASLEEVRNVRAAVDFTPKTQSGSLRMSLHKRTRHAAMFAMSRSARSSLSCRGISRSGRYFDLQRQRSWLETSVC